MRLSLKINIELKHSDLFRKKPLKLFVSKDKQAPIDQKCSSALLERLQGEKTPLILRLDLKKHKAVEKDRSRVKKNASERKKTLRKAKNYSRTQKNAQEGPKTEKNHKFWQ